jgi:hypothetical protein
MAAEIRINYGDNRTTQIITATTQIGVEEPFFASELRIVTGLTGAATVFSRMSCIEPTGEKRGRAMVYERLHDPRDHVEDMVEEFKATSNRPSGTNVCRSCQFSQSGTSLCPINNQALQELRNILRVMGRKSE